MFLKWTFFITSFWGHASVRLTDAEFGQDLLAIIYETPKFQRLHYEYHAKSGIFAIGLIGSRITPLLLLGSHL